MRGIVIASALMGWVGGTCWLGMSLVDTFSVGHPSKWAYLAATCLWVVIPMGLLIDWSIAADARPLCLQGHEEIRVHRGWAMVGKVAMPTTRQARIWVCDVRSEEER